MIKKIEQISYNAWPALNTIVYDGWILRLSDGVTRRANSINPIFESTIDTNDKIDFCENLFRKNHLPVTYKLTSQTYPHDLDSILAERGYLFDAETSVQVSRLENIKLDSVSDNVQINETLDQSWLDRSLIFNNYDIKKKKGFENIMKQIALKTGFLDFIIDEKSVGCGLGVIEGDYVGLFDIVLDPEYRGNGYGMKLTKSLMDWGKINGCKTAYLQVMTNNPTAQNLYKKIGFKEVYKYWYRIKE